MHPPCENRTNNDPHVYVNGPRCYYCNQLTTPRERAERGLRTALANLQYIEDSDLTSTIVNDAERLGDFFSAHAVTREGFLK